MKNLWPWVAVALLAGWVLFVVNSPKREEAKPGSPEYEAWFRELVNDCVYESMRQDRANPNSIAPPLTKQQHEALCRSITTKTLDRYPGVRPPRVVVPN